MYEITLDMSVVLMYNTDRFWTLKTRTYSLPQQKVAHFWASPCYGKHVISPYNLG